MFRGKVAALLNFRVLTKTISRLRRKKKEIPGSFGHKPAVFRLLVRGTLDFGLFNMKGDDQSLLESCVPALGEAGHQPSLHISIVRKRRM